MSRAGWNGPATHRHGDGNGHHAGEAAPVWPVGGGPGEDVDDPSGGAGPLPPGAPCPDRVVTQDGTPAHGCVIWVRVAVT